MILTKEQRLEAYTFVYFALLAGKNKGEWFDGYPKSYVCDWLRAWVHENTKYDNSYILPYSIEFSEWFDQRPQKTSKMSGLGWWPQDSPERIKAIRKCIAKCEQAKQ